MNTVSLHPLTDRPPTHPARILAIALVAAAGLGLGVVAGAWLIPAVVGLGVLCVMGFRRPILLLALVFTALCMDSAGVTGLSVAGLPLTAAKLAVATAILIWLAHALIEKKAIVHWHPVLSALCLLVGAMGLSMMTNRFTTAGVHEALGVAMLTVLVALVATALPPARLGAFMRFVGGVLVAVLLFNLLVDSGQRDLVTREPGTTLMRGRGTMGDPNYWAAFVLISVPTTIGMLARDSRRTSRAITALLFLLLPLTIVRSVSRSGFVALLLVLPGVLYCLRHRRGLLLAGVASAAVFVPFFVDWERAWMRLSTLFDPAAERERFGGQSLDERASLAKAGWAVLTRHWLLGVGVGELQYSHGYASTDFRVRQVHNTYLQLAAEQGVPGVLAFLALAGSLVRTGWRAFWGGRTEAVRCAAVGWLSGLVGFAAMAATLNLMTLATAFFVFGLGLVLERGVGEAG